MGTLFWNCSCEEAIQWCNENDENPTSCFIMKERILWGEDHSYAEPLDIEFWKKLNSVQQFGGNFINPCAEKYYIFSVIYECTNITFF